MAPWDLLDKPRWWITVALEAEQGEAEYEQAEMQKERLSSGQAYPSPP